MNVSIGGKQFKTVESEKTLKGTYFPELMQEVILTMSNGDVITLHGTSENVEKLKRSAVPAGE